MKLHIFNPEHDIALASNACAFTAPHAARGLHSDMGCLPALWADDGDMVLVEDVEASVEAVRHLKCHVADVLFVMPEDISSFQMALNQVSVKQMEISPWGWDRALKHQLIAINPEMSSLMPDDDYLAGVRETSNRRWAVKEVLAEIVPTNSLLIGQSEYIDNIDTLKELALSFNRSVIKAPWSSSGRGLRYIEYPFNSYQEGWAANIIRRQGGIMIEPYYNKVKDFGMEFEAADGEITYKGLSVFKTVNGAYAGNLIASDDAKRRVLSQYVQTEVIDNARETLTDILTKKLKGRYNGPFGIDMMIVADGGQLKLNPCVELNLRRTMGHVALAMSSWQSFPQRLMRITHANKYHLRVSEIRDEVINNTML